MVALMIVTAALSVGLTAPADGPFTIGIRPILLQMDPVAVAEARARALGLDVDVKVGPLYLHLGWAAIPLVTTSTAGPGQPL